MINNNILHKKIRERKLKRLVFNLEADAGFYSEFNNMIFSLIYCLENEISFQIQTSGKNNFFDKGWKDFFNPYFDEVNLPFLSKYNVRPYMTNGRSFPLMTFLLKNIYNIDYFTQDLFDIVRKDNRFKESVTIPQLNLEINFLEFCSVLINSCYVFNQKTELEINDLIGTIKLPNDFVAIHIRRGDKILEAPLYPENNYIDKAVQYSNNIYIHSDDYSTIDLIRKKYQNLNIFTLTQRDYTGYKHSDFIKLSSQQRKSVMINLFANVKIFLEANIFVGSFESNVGMFVAMARAGSNCFEVNNNEWQRV